MWTQAQQAVHDSFPLIQVFRSQDVSAQVDGTDAAMSTLKMLLDPEWMLPVPSGVMTLKTSRSVTHCVQSSRQSSVGPHSGSAIVWSRPQSCELSVAVQRPYWITGAAVNSLWRCRTLRRAAVR